MTFPLPGIETDILVGQAVEYLVPCQAGRFPSVIDNKCCGRVRKTSLVDEPGIGGD